ncbi:MAG: cold shock domain-containing protein, partial [Pseudomonadota bacterium]
GATLCTALLISLMQGSGLSSSNQRSSASSRSKQPIAKTSRPSNTAEHEQREVGSVKWFNVSKGYGFITKDDGEEIFVHFRSIKGGGRRGLKDGQRVSFVVVQSEKGPQAEDVERAS